MRGVARCCCGCVVVVNYWCCKMFIAGCLSRCWAVPWLLRVESIVVAPVLRNVHGVSAGKSCVCPCDARSRWFEVALRDVVDGVMSVDVMCQLLPVSLGGGVGSVR